MDLNSYLIHEKLFTDAPYDQEKLHQLVKLSVKPRLAVLENGYSYKSERVFCHICGGRRHFKGFTGILEDGQKILFGSKCAKDYFGNEITKKSISELKTKTRNAKARFKILCIRNSMEPIEKWLDSYEELFQKIDRGWINIEAQYSKPFLAIMDNLKKNNGRLVKYSMEIIGGNAKNEEHHRTSQILISIKNSNAIPILTQGQQQIALIRAFVTAIRSLDANPDEQLFINLVASYQRAIKAAENADAILSFTIDFFNQDKLGAISNWYQEYRVEKLHHRTKVTKQDVGGLFTKFMGTGLELPPTRLKQMFENSEKEFEVLMKTAKPLQSYMKATR